MHGCVVHRILKNFGRESSWCGFNLRYHGLLPPFLIPNYGSNAGVEAKLDVVRTGQVQWVLPGQGGTTTPVTGMRITTLMLYTLNHTSIASGWCILIMNKMKYPADLLKQLSSAFQNKNCSPRHQGALYQPDNVYLSSIYISDYLKRAYIGALKGYIL